MPSENFVLQNIDIYSKYTIAFVMFIVFTGFFVPIAFFRSLFFELSW